MATGTAALLDAPVDGTMRDRSAATGIVQLGLVEDLAGFLSLRDEWDDLFDRAAMPHQLFQSHVVLRHWARHYLDASDRLNIVTGRRDGRLVMVWPLVRRTRLGIETLGFMGMPVAQFGDVLVESGGDETALLQAGWDKIDALGADIVEISKLRVDSALAQAKLFARYPMQNMEQAPFGDLAIRVGPDGPSQAYPARERSNHRRRLRRLAERGAISFDTAGPGPRAATLADEAVAMKRAMLLRHGIVAPAISDSRFARFFHDLAADSGGRSPLRVAVITCAGQPIGIDLSLDCKGVSFGHVIATHPDHERGGIGGILIHHSFASARMRGNRLFDLLAPLDPYKQEHADGTTEIGDRVIPLSLKGRLVCGLGLQHVRPSLKALGKRLPQAVTRRIAIWSNGGRMSREPDSSQ